LAVVAVLALAVLGLLAAGQRSAAGQVDISVQIDRPAAAIWPWLNEPDKVKQWVSWTKEVRNIDPGTNGVGARDIWVMEDRNNNSALMETEAFSTVYEPYRRMAARLRSKDAFEGEVAYELTEANGRTTVRMLGRYQYLHWLAKLFEPLITPAARDKAIGDFATLKRLVEAARP
jgi:carbon monoxide dehydrogenase subunit G